MARAGRKPSASEVAMRSKRKVGHRHPAKKSRAEKRNKYNGTPDKRAQRVIALKRLVEEEANLKPGVEGETVGALAAAARHLAPQIVELHELTYGDDVAGVVHYLTTRFAGVVDDFDPDDYRRQREEWAVDAMVHAASVEIDYQAYRKSDEKDEK